MNSIYGFLMLFYTDVLGFKASLVGWTMFAATGWDAITDPVMGHITDNTKSRFGRRHPYIFLGGIGVVVSFYFLWHIPAIFKESDTSLFIYLLVINLILRTASTVFTIPLTALGFEICTTYFGRVRLQGIRGVMAMLTNFLGPGLAWSIFFSNNEVTRATTVESNYLNMINWFSLVALISIFAVTITTAKYITDSRDLVRESKNTKAFFKDMKEIILDRHPRFVFVFMVVVTLGMVLVSVLQMYLYEHFMKFEGWEKTIAHGGSMAGCGFGCLFASKLTKYFDKKGTVYVGVALSVFCNLFIAIMFLPGILKPGDTIDLGGLEIPLALIAFVVPHILFWLGNGLLSPVATSMIADVSEINQLHTGVNKYGAYAAVYSFALKCATSFAFLISGYCLEMIGFEEGATVQTPEVVWKICFITLVVGPLILLLSLGLIHFYPVNKEFLNAIREKCSLEK